jgi:hypothetical protein
VAPGLPWNKVSLLNTTFNAAHTDTLSLASVDVDGQSSFG